MELRPLGRTGLKVSLLGLGAVKFGRNTGLKYPHRFALPSDAELRRLLAESHALGVNLIDTAPAYGASEARLGALLPGARTEWVLSTKVGEQYDEHGSRFDFSAEHTRRSVECSLQRLRTDYIDIVLVHASDDDLRVLEHSDCLPTLLQLQQQGCVRAVGFSAKTMAGALAALRCCDVVMLELPFESAAATAMFDAVARNGCGLLVKKALNSGYLPVTALRERFAWLRAHDVVSSIVVGTTDPLHLRTNVELLR